MIDAAVRVIRERPLPTAYAASLLVLMSPVSTSGHIAQSSAVLWLMVAILGAMCWRAGALRPRPVPRPLLFALGGLLFLVSLYALVGLARGNGIRLVAWEANPYFEFVAFLALARFAIRSSEDVKLVLVVILGGAVLKSCGDVLVFGWDLWRSPHHQSLQTGLSNRIEDVAPFLLAPVALILAAGWPLRRRSRAALFAVFLVLAAVMLASLTRSFWVGFVLAIVIAALVDRGPTARRVLASVAAVSCLLAVGFAIAPHGVAGAPVRLLKERLYDYTTAQARSPDLTLATRRQDELRQAWRSARYDWFLGRGLGGTMPRTFAPLTSTEGSRVAFLHNFFAQVLVKMGVVGLLAFFAVIAAAFAALHNALRSRRDFDRAVVAAVIAAWVMEGVQLLLYPKTNIFHVGAFMAALLGIVFFAGEEVPEEPAQLVLPTEWATEKVVSPLQRAQSVARVCVTAGLVYAASPLSFYLQFRGTSFYDAYPARSHLALDAAITMIPAVIALLVLWRVGLVSRSSLRPLLPRSFSLALLATGMVTLLAAALGLAFGNRPSLVAGDLEPYLEFGAYLVATVLSFSTVGQVRRAALWVFGSLCLTAVIRLGLATQMQHGLGVTGVYVGHHFVPRLFLLQPYGWLLGVALAVAVAATRPQARRLAILATAVFVLVTLVSFERALWFEAFVACTPALWALARRRPLRSVIGAVVAVPIILVAMTALLAATGSRANPVAAVFERLVYSKNQLSAPSGTLESKRSDETQRLLHAYRDDPKGWVFGQGLGAEYVGPAGLREGTYAKNFRRKHYVFDSYLALLLRTGAVGLVVNLWFVAALIWVFAKLARVAHSPVVRVAAAGSAAATLGLAVVGVLQPYLLAHPLAAFEAAALAMLLNIRRCNDVA